ncbi:hypothetical protein DL96DRAFT_1779913 [Flagelloscypha sp. PMI_526]|nr:hypothetical protein DL96DRAFT_1779913 [Flagelloscypha sp. PMI_526]
MSDSLSRTKGLRLLCFDGGGLCCLSQALIVKEMLDRLQYDSNSSRSLKVVDYFDMIGGSGFGGLLAIMAGILEMTVEELVSEFSSLCAFIFAGTPTIRERTERLKVSVKRIISQYSKGHGGEERTMLSGNDACKVFVCASSSSNMAFPLIFRNYIVRENQTSDCAVWQAACATMAMPGLFEPVEINVGFVRNSIVGGDTRWKNPVRWLAEEAANIFSGHHVACIVSIGSGHPHILSVSSDLASLFKGVATDCQLQANEMDARFLEAPDLYWRLEVEQGLQNLGSIEDVAAFTSILSSTASHLQRCTTIQNINALLEVLHTRPECLSTRAITGRVLATARTVRLKQCPNPTLYFTGKETELKQMTEYFNSKRDGCRVCVLWGLGGAGKTQMGLKFVLLNQNSKRQVASRVTIFDSQLNTSGLPMYSSLTPQTSIPFALISRPLQGPTRQDDWLLFIDNADDPSLNLRPFISWSHGNVLITTRNVAMRAHAPDCHLRVLSLTMEESVALLMRGLDLRMDEKTKSAASELVEELGFLPLAITHARAYLEHGSCDLEGYLELYRIDLQSLLQKRPVQPTDNYEYSVYSTWMLSFKRLSEHAVVFLQLLCFMHHEGIPVRIVEMAYRNLIERRDSYADCVPKLVCEFLWQFQSEEADWSPDRYHSLLNEILSLSLIQSDMVNHTLSIHPLVQKLLRSFSDANPDIITDSQSLLSLALPTGESSDDHACRRTSIIHLRSTVEYGIKLHPRLLYPFGRAYRDAGMHLDSCRIFETAVEGMKRLLGPEHPDTLTTMHNLASSYTDLGRATEAASLTEQVLALRKRIIGPEHPNTLMTMNNLANSYRDLGRATEALSLKEQVLALAKRIIGPEHPLTLTTMHNLASSYRDLGRATEALSLKEQVLALRKRIIGPEHPLTLTTMISLANSYTDLGRAPEALLLNEQVLALTKRILGPEHPDTLGTMHNLANSYRDLGRATEALSLNEQALALRKRIIGPEHPLTLTTMNNLADSYTDLGRAPEALSLKEQVLALRKRIIGPEHPLTLTTMHNLAILYRDLGRATEALSLNEQLLALRNRILGSQHPRTLQSMSNLAACYRILGYTAQEVDVQEQILDLGRRVHGPEHADTLQSISNLAVSYMDLGRVTEAILLTDQLLELRQRVPG